jgi:hypothetical protein
VEERDRVRSSEPETEAQKDESEDVEAHKKFKAADEGTEEGAGDDDVELHRKLTR